METSPCPLPSLDWRFSTKEQQQADLLSLNAVLHAAGISEQLIFLPMEHSLALYLQQTDDHGDLWLASMPEPYQLDPPEDDPEDLWDEILYAHRHLDPEDPYGPHWFPMPSTSPSPFPLDGIVPRLWDVHTSADYIQQDFERYNTALRAAGISDSLIGLRYYSRLTGSYTPYDTYLLHTDAYGTAWIANNVSINAGYLKSFDEEGCTFSPSPDARHVWDRLAFLQDYLAPEPVPPSAWYWNVLPSSAIRDGYLYTIPQSDNSSHPLARVSLLWNANSYLDDLDVCQSALHSAIGPDRLVIVAYGSQEPFFAHPWPLYLLHTDNRGTDWMIPMPAAGKRRPSEWTADPRPLWDTIQHARHLLTLAPAGAPPTPWRPLPSSVCKAPNLYRILDS